MVGAIQVEHYAAALRKTIAFPVEVVAHACGDEREEWIEAAHLLHEQFDVAGLIIDDSVAALRMCDGKRRIVLSANAQGARCRTLSQFKIPKRIMNLELLGSPCSEV